MESWSYPSEEKTCLLSDETDFSLEALIRGRKALVEWDNKTKDEFSSDGEEVIRVNSSTHLKAMDSFFVEEESESKLSGTLVESKSHGSSLIDLKLGRLADCNYDATKSDKVAKRARSSASPTQKPACQVYGCNMDLSSSKEYHKRHKVCDAHSKTARVIVNGIEQRFCQQCSRFVIFSPLELAFHFFYPPYNKLVIL